MFHLLRARRNKIFGLPRRNPKMLFAHLLTCLRLAGFQHLLILVLSALLALSLSFLSPVRPALAQTNSFTICRTAPPQDKQQICTGADPYQGGCTFDSATLRQPETVAWKEIVFDGKIIGRAEVRYSPSCNTYWARGLSFLPNTRITVYLPALGKGDVASYLSNTGVAYSNMIYGIQPSVTVRIILSRTQGAIVMIPGEE